VRIVVDPSAASFITACEERGLDVVPAENDVLDGIRFVSSLLADVRYTIDPTCEHTVREYQSYVWDEKAQQRGEDKPKKENDHSCDRDRYGLFTTLWPGHRTLDPDHIIGR
jgi:phage terminase large subunit